MVQDPTLVDALKSSGLDPRIRKVLLAVRANEKHAANGRHSPALIGRDEPWRTREDPFEARANFGSRRTRSTTVFWTRRPRCFSTANRKRHGCCCATSSTRRWARSVVTCSVAAGMVATGAQYQISDLGHHPLWSSDGRELFYFPGANRLVVVGVTTQPSFTFGNPALVPGGFASNTTPAAPRNHDVTPDGKLITVVPSGKTRPARPPLQRFGSSSTG